MAADLEVTGLVEMQALLVRITPAIDASMIAVAEEARDRIAPYPAASRKKQAFKTTKQRRGFFAKLRAGQITVPYRRSGDTLGRWSQPIRQGRAVVLRNTSPHAVWVHSAAGQAGYHKGRWKTDAGVAEQIANDGTAERIVEQAVQQAIGGTT